VAVLGVAKEREPRIRETTGQANSSVSISSLDLATIHAELGGETPAVATDASAHAQRVNASAPAQFLGTRCSAR
jgi:hypothetical protein